MKPLEMVTLVIITGLVTYGALKIAHATGVTDGIHEMDFCRYSTAHYAQAAEECRDELKVCRSAHQ